MLLLRQLLRSPATRFYAKKAGAKVAVTTTTNTMSMKQVHQETLRHINPYARINIRTDVFLRVRSADVHQYPDADAFIAELHGGHVSNCTANMKVQVSDDEKCVDVVVTKTADNCDFHCELEVPVRAELHIEAKDAVSVTAMYCDEVYVQAAKQIKTKEIRAERITLQSDSGNIACAGLLLGKNSKIETKQNGHITLDKLQGEVLSCKTNGGNIHTNSCYVDVSKFETNTGNMQLKNIHKKSEIIVHKKGDLEMTGVHGNIHIRSNAGKMNLQMSELSGENLVTSTDAGETANINISDTIEENSFIDISSATAIELESALSHLSDCLSENKHSFRMSVERDNRNKLVVNTKGGIKLGKLSWMESMRASMAQSDK